jgi:drug/metabolite transporter (DMT)-like permease
LEEHVSWEVIVILFSLLLALFDVFLQRLFKRLPNERGAKTALWLWRLFGVVPFCFVIVGWVHPEIALWPRVGLAVGLALLSTCVVYLYWSHRVGE